MFFAIVAITSLLYFFILIKFMNNIILQQVGYLFVFMFGLTLVGNLDVLLPIYFIVSFVSFIFKIRKISILFGFLIIYFFIYLLFGFSTQSFTGTAVTFIAKYWQFLVFFLVYDSKVSVKPFNLKRIIILSFIIESALGIYLFFNSSMFDVSSGLVRLVSNAQPITGNISIAFLPLLFLYYFYNKDTNKKYRFVFFISIGMMIWIILSGTRGYMLVFFGFMFVLIYDYLVNKRGNTKKNKNTIIALIAVVFFMIITTLFIPQIFDRLLRIMRVEQSTGVRVYENQAYLDFLINAPLHNSFFGIGLGGIAGNNPAMKEALYKQFSLGMWNHNYYLTHSGAIFHNLYANIGLCNGVLGLLVIFLANWGIWKRITFCCSNNTLARKAFHVYQICFLLMNYFRWSAICGIAEMIILALALKYISIQSNISIEDVSNDQYCNSSL